MTQALKGN